MSLLDPPSPPAPPSRIPSWIPSWEPLLDSLLGALLSSWNSSRVLPPALQQSPRAPHELLAASPQEGAIVALEALDRRMSRSLSRCHGTWRDG